MFGIPISPIYGRREVANKRSFSMARVALLMGVITIAIGGLEALPALDEEYDIAWDTVDQVVEDVSQKEVEDQENTFGLLNELQQDNWIPTNLEFKEFPKASIEKRRNRIPLEWKGLKKDQKSSTQKILPDSLKMFFTRMKPKLSGSGNKGAN